MHLRDALTDMNSSGGLTLAAEDNKFSHGEHPMQMDYILYKIQAYRYTNEPHDPNDSHDPHARLQLVSSDVYKGLFTDAQGKQTPLSDHYGVTAEFVFGPTCDQYHSCKQQALGENSKERTSPLARKTSCVTTTCVVCEKQLPTNTTTQEHR